MVNPNEKQIQIKASDEVLRGTYTTMAQIAHSREEFVFDFMTTYPPQPQLVSRIILSPSHAKRMLAALNDNVKKYEAQHGKINEGQNPSTAGEIGFKG